MEKQMQPGQRPAHTEAFLKKRKFYLVIPMLVIPFLTLAFWALGGGKVAPEQAAEPKQGINMALPSAQFKDKPAADKMAIYRSQAKDTAVRADFIAALGFDSLATPPHDPPKNADQQRALIEARLTQLNEQLRDPVQASPKTNDARLDQFESPLQPAEKAEEDPELKQLDAMLSKIQAIQQPASPAPERPAVQPVDSAFQAIQAVIDGQQKVVNGGTVRLRLSDTVTLQGILLPKGQLLSGACQVTNQRLLLTIRNIRLGKNIIPADLTVFSLDGMPGIPAPEAVLTEAVDESLANTVAGMQVLSGDQSIAGQAAASGITAVKQLFNKKASKIKVKLPADFSVLLRNNSRKK